jgi:hypothetical protein
MQISTGLHFEKKVMQKITLSILLNFMTSVIFGQKYNTVDIIKKADSIIIEAVGQKIFKDHYKFDSASYFETKTLSNHVVFKTLTRTKKTKGDINYITVRYIFYIKKFEQPFVGTSLFFDKDLKLSKPIDTSFIPKFILNETSNDFITKEDVLKIAKDKFIRKGLKPIETSLTYEYSKSVYVWSVVNIIDEWKDAYNNTQKEVELLEINAINGQVINFYPNALQGKIY